MHNTHERTRSSSRSKNKSTGGPPLAVAAALDDETKPCRAGTYTIPVLLPPGDIILSIFTYLFFFRVPQDKGERGETDRGSLAVANLVTVGKGCKASVSRLSIWALAKAKVVVDT